MRGQSASDKIHFHIHKWACTGMSKLDLIPHHAPSCIQTTRPAVAKSGCVEADGRDFILRASRDVNQEDTEENLNAYVSLSECAPYLGKMKVFSLLL